MNINDEIKKLKQEGKTIYSISRLNTVDNCGWEYWQTYQEHLQGKDNIYGFTGTRIHQCLEDIQNGIKVDFPSEVIKMLDEAKILDIVFPSKSIEEKWKKDITSFVYNYVPPVYNKVETEKKVLIELDGNYLQGIIDLVIYNEDGTVSIRDYKTSSKFTNADLEEKGRQLILYGLAMEEVGYKVKDLAWEMLKYVEISYKLKNGNIRKTVAERGFILEKLKSDITKEMRALKKYSDLEIEMLVDNAVESNSFDTLPNSIREKYTIQDYICYYDFTEERKEETKAFIKAKIEQIENFKDNKDWWEPRDITPYSSFYCVNLCNHRENCEYLQDFLEKQNMYKEEKENREIDDELAKFIFN